MPIKESNLDSLAQTAYGCAPSQRTAIHFHLYIKRITAKATVLDWHE